MMDRVEMLEATLDLVGGAIAVLDNEANVVFWNRAATELTGYSAQDLISQPCPKRLYEVDAEHHIQVTKRTACMQQQLRSAGISAPVDNLGYASEITGQDDNTLHCPTLVSLTHRLGHSFPGMLRKEALYNSLGKLSGTALLFYPVEEVNSLPHGELGEGVDIERSQAEMEDRLDAIHHLWTTAGLPYGVLWITVDQAQSLRRTHGRDACEAMLRTVEQTLLRHLKPAEIIGRWGDDEFLVLVHERTSDLLVEHARHLTGVARTADFRWWGDRVGLTVSIGASLAAGGETLQTLLSRARHAMHASEYAGGNQVTEARGR